MSHREPLVGLPERALAGLRRLLHLLDWPLALAMPLAVLPRLAAPARLWLPSPAARGALALALVVGTVAATRALVGAVARRLHLGRDVALGEAGLWVSLRRRPGRAPFRLLDEPGSGPALVIPYPRVRELFRVSLEGTRPPMVSVGLWFEGDDGRAREMWWHLEADDAGTVLARLETLTGLTHKGPRDGGPE